MERRARISAAPVDTALAATASRLGLVATGHRTHDRIGHSYGIIKRFIPDEVPCRRPGRRRKPLVPSLSQTVLRRIFVPL
jgi:hypothetical protein